MEAKNVIGQKIVIEGSYFEVAHLSVIVDEFIKNNPSDELAKEFSQVLHNPKVEK